MRTLPPEGIVVVVGLFPPTEATPGPVFPPRQLPLQLSDFEIRPSWEGQVSPNIPEYRLWAPVGGRDVDVAIKPLIQRELADRLATMLLAGEASEGDEVEVDATPEGLVPRVAERVGA